MFPAANSVLQSSSVGLPAIISKLAVTAGVALLNHVVNSHLSGSLHPPNPFDEFAIPRTSGLSGPKSLKTAEASSPSTTIVKIIPTAAYPYQYPSWSLVLTLLLCAATLSMITSVLALGPSFQAPTVGASAEVRSSRQNTNRPPQRRNGTSLNGLTVSDRTPPQGQHTEGNSRIAKKRDLQQHLHVAQGDFPPPPPPPSPPALDSEDGSNKSDLDWISVLLLLPILILLLRRLLACLQIINKTPGADKPITSFANVRTDLSALDEDIYLEATCADHIPWNYPSCRTPDSLHVAGILSGSSVATSQSLSPAPSAKGRLRGMATFCLDLGIFLTTCALLCCAFLLYFSLGFDGERNINPNDKQLEEVIMEPVSNGLDESWRNVETRDANDGLPGEASMYLIIAGNSDENQVEGSTSCTTLPEFETPPSRANLDPMAKTFIPRQPQSLNFVHVPESVVSSAPNAIEPKDLVSEKSFDDDTARPH